MGLFCSVSEMKITSAEFIKSVASMGQLPKDGLPEVAFAGRSNVGKSSLLNALLNRKKLAQTSSTPGKTRLINFFRINKKFYFVDLPGYGYARVSRNMKQNWRRLIENYLLNSSQLRGVVLIIDIRHQITQSDLDLLAWLYEKGLSTIVVGTKADKLSANKLQKQLSKNNGILKNYGIDHLFLFSAITGRGKPELWKAISLFIES